MNCSKVMSEIPVIHDTDTPIDCPLCHGSGKTTGRKVLWYVDSIAGMLTRQLEHVQKIIRKEMLSFLWNVDDTDE